ncbi:MAG: DNA repair protein RecO [Nitrospinota bacterium]|nr:DNA repair protein RecO [Nitrospinota bacterium]
MGLYNTKAIVLRSIKLAENDKLVTFLTEDFGKIKCAAKGARSIKSKFGAALESMSFIQLIYFGKENQSIYRLNHCDILESFQSIRDDFEKVYTAVYFNELVDALSAEGDRTAKLFHFLLETFYTLKDQAELETLCPLFEMRIMALSGYMPQLDHCVLCKTVPAGKWVDFSYKKSGVACINCCSQTKPNIRIRAGTLNYLKKLLSIDVRQTQRLKIPKSLEREIESLTHKMVSQYVVRELKSYPFIRKMTVT